MSILGAFYSLGSRLNKTKGKSPDEETTDGESQDKLPELEIEMGNEEIIKLVKEWKNKWETSEVYSVWKEACDENENYWKGKQFEQLKSDSARGIVDNVIFEALETYLPQVTRRNPDPMVTLSRKSEQTPDNLSFAKEMQKELGEIADDIVLRLKLKKAARHWALYLLGVIKIGWDLDKDMPTAKDIRPKKLILDPDATVDEERGYTGAYLGEYRKMTASELVDTIKSVGGEAEAIRYIQDKITNDKGEEELGTEIKFIEWWTPEYMCWTLGDKVLLKKRNPHWNYDETKQEEAPYDEMGNPQIDPMTGSPMMNQVQVKGENHLPTPAIPYILLSVFNLGKQPVDDTSLIGQNLSNQDVINKRIRQIDKNADSMNGGMAVSLEKAGMTEGQAAKVTEAVRKGGTVAIPSGSVNEAIARLTATSLPADIYNQLVDIRARVRDIFGVRGSSAAGLATEDTVRGKLQSRMLDTDRIGGGFSEYLEQMADKIYNWFVQMLYVYDERFIGAQNKPTIIVSVKEGSLLPKDSITLANQAIELAAQNRMSLVDLYKALDYPNPEELAANVWLEANAPELLFQNDQRVQQVIASRQQAASGGDVSKSISYKDLPPDGQAQMAKQAGIELDPEGIAAYDENKNQKEIEQKRSMPLPKINEMTT